MANPVVDATVAQINATVPVLDRATSFVNGVKAKIDAAVAAKVDEAVKAALANGATEAELAPLTDLVTALKAATDHVDAALVANP